MRQQGVQVLLRIADPEGGNEVQEGVMWPGFVHESPRDIPRLGLLNRVGDCQEFERDIVHDK
jgi:hypothetical protein